MQRECVRLESLCAINSAACEEDGTYIRACLLFWLVGATFCVRGNTMHPYQTTSSSSFSVASNIVDLKHYRNVRRLRSTGPARSPLRGPERSSADVWLPDDYRERMKVNVVVFVFLMLLITSGVWLLDGLSASFGPEQSAPSPCAKPRHWPGPDGDATGEGRRHPLNPCTGVGAGFPAKPANVTPH